MSKAKESRLKNVVQVYSDELLEAVSGGLEIDLTGFPVVFTGLIQYYSLYRKFEFTSYHHSGRRINQSESYLIEFLNTLKKEGVRCPESQLPNGNQKLLHPSANYVMVFDVDNKWKCIDKLIESQGIAVADVQFFVNGYLIHACPANSPNELIQVMNLCAIMSSASNTLEAIKIEE